LWARWLNRILDRLMSDHCRHAAGEESRDDRCKGWNGEDNDERAHSAHGWSSPVAFAEVWLKTQQLQLAYLVDVSPCADHFLASQAAMVVLAWSFS